ncbi:hypothetical protein ABFT23_16110 [Nocardioides sp. C4-1]|uniref:hypothetical protein n=1 Tax=Nocardioides sp. C4-1 TaxID=3151851 RepID=UPI003267A13A
MSQTAPGAPVPAPQARTATPAPVGAAAPAPQDARFTENVPQVLNRLQALAVAACLVFGIAAAVVQVLSWQAAGRAADNTEQVVRVQQIQSLLLRAEAVATNSYLYDGLEPAEARAEYDEAIDDALRLITDAAEAQPADRAVLADLNSTVSTYTNRVSQARDLNRQQLPIGIAYLTKAREALRGSAADQTVGAVQLTQALVDANTERAEDEMHGQHPFWLLGLGALALVALFLVNRQVARRFHRRFNVGLVVAALAVLVLTVLSAGRAVVKNNDDDATRDGPYRTAVDEATARTAANDAKAYESGNLIARGSGAAYDTANFAPAAERVEQTASDATLALWRDYLAQHEAVRELDDAGDWNGAVARVRETGEGSPTALLDAVDESAAGVVDASGAEAVDGFRSGGALSVGLAVVTLLGALFAAVAATRGIGVRRKEYS